MNEIISISSGVYLYCSVLHSSSGSVNETWMYRDGCMVPTFLEDDIHQVHSSWLW